MTNTEKKIKVKKIISILHKKFGEPKCELQYKTDFELLVAVILSAQCTDVRVNIVTKKMFQEINTPSQFAAMSRTEIETWIKSTGFYHNKAKNIQLCAQKLLKDHEGKVPQKMEELLALPGVGRKTANVVRGELWGLASGITVDTHVKRLSNLIGLVENLEDPVKIEQELMQIVPLREWINISHYLILQGRSTCIARRPKCVLCEIKNYCNYASSK
jgi:endonuclease-3